MSKRDKFNRFADKPNFAEDKAVIPASLNSKPVVYDPDENERISYFSKIGTFFAGCWKKIATFSKSAVSITWSGLKKIPSYCVIRWDSKDETVSPEAPSKPEPVAVKAAPVKADYDEDELPPSRWWNIGIKTAALAAALLILAGGYFGVTALLQKTPVEVANVEDSTEPTVVNVPQEPVQESPFAATVAPPVSELQSPQTPVIPAQVGIQTEDINPASLDPRLRGGDEKNAFAVLPTPTPTVAEAVPLIADDPFASVNVPAEPPAPVAESVASANVVENELLPTTPALQPLDSLESVQIAQAPPQLQPLATLNSSAPPSAVAAVPTAATATNFNSRQTRRNGNTSTFSEPPTAPVVHPIPQTTIPQTIAMPEPVKEIVPQIPPSGTVQNVPPPVAPPTPAVAEVVPARSVYANESAPVIPKDAPPTATPVVVVPVVPALTTESSPQILSADSQPMDWQLWEQIRELRSETEAEPSNLRFDGTAAASEPALRFTPKESATAPSVANTGNNVMSESVEALQNLLPTGPANMESAFAALENAPQPVYAEARPAYRNNQADGEKGMTFQSRIDSEIKRSPSETETYVVQQGDTYMTISDKFYGTSLLYTSLAQHNQQLGIGWRPTEGVVIEVPTAEYLRMHYGVGTNQRERRLDAQRSAIRYTVQEGDTIFRLATDKLQDSTRWREIYAMNADRLQSVQDLKPGMEILLPAETARLNRQQTY